MGRSQKDKMHPERMPASCNPSRVDDFVCGCLAVLRRSTTGSKRGCFWRPKSVSSLLFLCLIAFDCLTSAAEPEVRLPQKHLTLLENYCFDCHDADTQKGKVNLETLPFHITTMEQAELWQKILNALNAGEMPPEDERQPENAAKADFLEDLAQTMVDARKTFSDTGGKITMRRLNRREYRNSIKHLTGVTLDVSALPADGGSGNFDTVGSSLFISSDQIEQYLKLGRSAIGEWFERRAALGQGTRVFRVEPENTVNVESANAIKSLEETYDRFMRWRTGVDKAAAAPENREIIARLQQENPTIDRSAFPEKPGLDFYRRAQELIGAPDPRMFGFTDDNRAVFLFSAGYQRKHAYLKHYAELPLSDRGTYVKLAWGIQRIDVLPDPKDVPPGSYRLRIRAGRVEDSDPSRHFIEIGHPQRVNQVRAGFASLPISGHQVTGTLENPEVIEIPIEIGPDTPREFGIQERRPTNHKIVINEYNRNKRENGYGTPPAIWIDWIELEGPLPSSEKDFSQPDWWVNSQTTPKESRRVRQIFERFSFAAFRSVEPESGFIERLSAIYQTRRDAGKSFQDAIELPLGIILASPGFLYLDEPNDAGDRRSLTGRELAVRLAYFLWSGPPDEELLLLADQNTLHESQVLRKQVDRLIADPRSDEFVSGFVHQWLDMERLDFFQFDPVLHREFDESARSAARREVYQSFAHLLRDSDKGRLGNLLKADHVFINGLLATYYGIEGVTGDGFRQVSLPEDSPRGGLLGMAAIHAMGSDGIRSSPVERGAWVLRHLLHDPPPPAPPNVPQLSRFAGKPLSTREQLAAHQEEAQCASCHRKIDPVGLGLENFTAAGKWRNEERQFTKNRKGRIVLGRHATPIDSSGRFHNGPAFANYEAFRSLVAQREPDFARGFTEALIGYALGRPFGFTDKGLAQEILTAAKSKQYSVSEFVQALVQSRMFRQK